MERLDQQVCAYTLWKQQLCDAVVQYRAWLVDNRLSSDSTEATLERALKLLRNDRITLAFVGEFSRGKTELINSLFFSNYGQRMLPSRAGRTTMCPTEMFYDDKAEPPYLRLLPIETRLKEQSVTEHKQDPDQWVTLTLDPDNPESMASAFSQVAKTKVMPIEYAMQMGFEPDMLEPAAEADQVHVPAWRHALIHLDHPLLRNGLNILDTPGLNALGSEPELTLSMLPNAQAIVFMLSADTGVTASDMQIWQEHIRELDADTQANLYAVLNKIDVLWDDLADDYQVQTAIDEIHLATAQKLGLKPQDVLPLSAKKALIAKVRDDQELLKRSRITALETLLCEGIALQKERLLNEQVVQKILSLLHSNQHLLGLRLDKAREQQALLSGNTADNQRLLFELTERTKIDHQLHQKRLVGLKTNQRLLATHTEPLLALCNLERYENYVAILRTELNHSWTTVGINQAIVNFFSSIRSDVGALHETAGQANQLVAAMFARHNAEYPGQNLTLAPFSTQDYLRELNHLEHKADQFRLHPKTLLTEQKALSKRFFNTLVQEVMQLLSRLNNYTQQWSNEVLMPLMQHTLEHKQLLESHMLRLKTLSQDTQTAKQRSQLLSQYIENLELQMQKASTITRVIGRPAPGVPVAPSMTAQELPA